MNSEGGDGGEYGRRTLLAGSGGLPDGAVPPAHDRAVLRAIRAALPPGAPLILTTLNAIARLREISDADVRQGRFDLRTLEEIYTETEESDDGAKRLRLKERRWLPPELIAL